MHRHRRRQRAHLLLALLAMAFASSRVSADLPAPPAAPPTAPPTTTIASLALPELAARATRSVVLLSIFDGAGKKIGAGTGFFVSTDGRIVTNAHVIEGAAAVTASFAEGDPVKVLGILASDAEKDIAIVKAAGGPFAPLTLGESQTLRPGDDIVVLGSPQGLSTALSTGIIAAKREKGLEEESGKGSSVNATAWTLQITAAISPGSSGSPILDRRGQVVGVVVGKYRTEALQFGVKIEVAKGLLSGLAPDAAIKPFGTPGELARNLAISGGLLAAVGVAYLVHELRKKQQERKRLRSLAS